MHYICRIDNPNIIKACGYTTEMGGLGDYDTTIYKEIAGDLPVNHTIEDPIETAESVASSAANTSDPSTATSPPKSPSVDALLPSKMTDQQLQAQLTALLAQLKTRGLIPE